MAKRHVYAHKLSKLLGVPNVSFGTLVCQELQSHSPIYKHIYNSLNQGNLVFEDVIFGLSSKRLEEAQSKEDSGFILDGIPHTRNQAKILDQIVEIVLVVNLRNREEDCLVKSDMLNGVYSPSRDFFRMGRSRFNLNLGLQDDDLISPSLNVENVWKENLQNYDKQSRPVEKYYRKHQKLVDCRVSEAPAETWQLLLAAFHLQHINAMSSL